MKFSDLTTVAITFIALLTSAAAYSQGVGGGSSGLSVDDPSRAGSNSFGSGLNGLNSETMRQLSNYVDVSKSINRKDLKNVPVKEEVIKRANELVAAIKLPCTLKDAQLVGLSNETTGGKIYQTSVYEIACTNGMGYFLVSNDQLKKAGAKPDPALAANTAAITCMSAEKIHDDDVAKGVQSDFYCQLPDNGGGDIKVMGERLLAAASVKCKVSQFKWFGVKEETKTEFTEASCDDGTGYLLQTALPGTDVSPTAMNCSDAARKGLECRMTPVVMPPTLATFKDYLATTNVNCKVSSYDQVKVLGQESVKQRYVVEFKCPQQPSGLVAYIPLQGNSNPFEHIDCATAAKRGLNCKLNAAK